MTRVRDTAEAIALPLLALAGGLGLFGVFVWFDGHDPVQAWTLLFRGAFGDAFSIQNTLQRAAPLMLTALCVALPARAGLTIIGGDTGQASSPASRAPDAVNGSTIAKPSPASTMLRII